MLPLAGVAGACSVLVLGELQQCGCVAVWLVWNGAEMSAVPRCLVCGWQN